MRYLGSHVDELKQTIVELRSENLELRQAIERIGYRILDGDFVGKDGHHRFYLEMIKGTP